MAYSEALEAVLIEFSMAGDMRELRLAVESARGLSEPGEKEIARWSYTYCRESLTQGRMVTSAGNKGVTT